MSGRPERSTLFPYTTLFLSDSVTGKAQIDGWAYRPARSPERECPDSGGEWVAEFRAGRRLVTDHPSKVAKYRPMFGMGGASATPTMPLFFFRSTLVCTGG